MTKTEGIDWIDLADVRLEEQPRYRWGEWRLRPRFGDLFCKRYYYSISLDSCLGAAQILDWIAQISHKSWATDAILADLVRALDEIIDLQGNACGWGCEPPDAESRIRRRLAGKGINLTTEKHNRRTRRANTTAQNV